MTKSKMTVIGGALGIFLMLIAAWFLVLGSRMAEPGAIKEQTETVQAATQVTRAKVAELEQTKATLPDLRIEAKKLAERFPSTAAQPKLLTMVRQAATDAGIPESAISDLTPSVPMLVGGAGGPTTLADNGAPDPAAAGAAPAPGAAPAAPAAPSAGQVAAMTVSVTVETSQQQAMKFISKLERLDRDYLITSISMTSGESGVTLSVTGSMFMLPAIVDPEADLLDENGEMPDQADAATEAEAAAG